MNDFASIEARRQAAGITRKALYERASVHKETWRRLINGRNLPNLSTLQRLTAALEELEGERAS